MGYLVRRVPSHGADSHKFYGNEIVPLFSFRKRKREQVQTLKIPGSEKLAGFLSYFLGKQKAQGKKH